MLVAGEERSEQSHGKKGEGKVRNGMHLSAAIVVKCKNAIPENHDLWSFPGIDGASQAQGTIWA